MRPRYCCVILHCPERGYLLEQRPIEPHHLGSLTCFGGGREEDESEEACGRRELDEELGWSVGPLSRRFELWKGSEWIATFFDAQPPCDSVPLRAEAGHAAVWIQPQHLATADVSVWHRAVLDAHIALSSENVAGGDVGSREVVKIVLDP